MTKPILGGRPKRRADGSGDTILTVRVTRDERAHYVAQARARGEKVAEQIRRFLELAYGSPDSVADAD